MPLRNGNSQSTISHNIAVERAAGKKESQAVAIAMSKVKDGKEVEYKGYTIVSKGMGTYTAYAPSKANGPGQMSGSLSDLKKRIDAYAKDAALPKPVPVRGKDDVADALQTYVYKLKQRGISEKEAIKLANELYAGVKSSLGEPKPAKDRVLGHGAVGDDIPANSMNDGHLAEIKKAWNSKIYAHYRAIYNAEGKVAADKYLQQFTTRKVGDLEPVPVKDTEWTDPKPKGKYGLTTSGAVGDGSLVATQEKFLTAWKERLRRAKNDKDPEAIKNAQLQIAELVESIRRNRAKGDDLEPVPVKDTKYAIPPRPGKPITSLGLKTPAEVESVYRPHTMEELKKGFGKDSETALCPECYTRVPLKNGVTLKHFDRSGNKLCPGSGKVKAPVKDRFAQANDAVAKIYDGSFAKLENSLAKKPGVANPAALAASIGRKKYGEAGMERKSEAGRGKDEDPGDEKTWNSAPSGSRREWMDDAGYDASDIRVLLTRRWSDIGRADRAQISKEMPPPATEGKDSRLPRPV